MCSPPHLRGRLSGREIRKARGEIRFLAASTTPDFDHGNEPE
jgi:hypothetical protein